jgi:DNA-binding transcriptional MerR regulator
MQRAYRAGEFAVLTGVSVRTLHHYDRIGLLRPSEYSEGGHRLYREPDLLRLQQVLTLRYLGFPLRQIDELLRRPDFNLAASLRVQRTALRDRISELERIDAALGALLEQRRISGRWDWDLVVSASAAVQDGLSDGGEAMERTRSYYTPEQLKQFEEVGAKVGAEEIREIEQLWTALLAEVRANRDLDPTSEAARALADRWAALTERTMRGYQDHPELMQAIGENYRQGRFDDVPQAPHAEDFAFIARVNEARPK